MTYIGLFAERWKATNGHIQNMEILAYFSIITSSLAH
jgi:hypothetical protein